MKKTTELLDDIKSKHGLSSDYALAKFAGISKQAISNYRARKSFLDDEMAEKVARLLELSPAYVIACAHAERAKSDPQRRIWESIADKFAVGIMSTRRRPKFRPDPAAPLLQQQQAPAAITRLFFCSKRDLQHGANNHARPHPSPWHVATARHH